ncbi:MAG: MATE family efflux transporter [Pilosibacter sp.]
MAAENDLGRDDIKKLVVRIAIPSMLAQFVSVLYSIVDRMYIGNIPGSGDMALAGAGVCGPVVTMVGSVAFLVGIGGAPLMSMKMGQGDKKAAERILANCFLMLAVCSLLMVACICNPHSDAAVFWCQRYHAALRKRMFTISDWNRIRPDVHRYESVYHLSGLQRPACTPSSSVRR